MILIDKTLTTVEQCNCAFTEKGVVITLKSETRDRYCYWWMEAPAFLFLNSNFQTLFYFRSVKDAATQNSGKHHWTCPAFDFYRSSIQSTS